MNINGWLQRAKQDSELKFSRLQRQWEPEAQRFAEFGRVSAGLLHEISTPLAAAALTLDQIENNQHNQLVRSARQDLRQLEKYVTLARKQLKSESRKTSFSLSLAINQVLSLINVRAQEKGIKLQLRITGGIRLYGDPVKLHQILSNLIINAIESYDGVNSQQKLVKVSALRDAGSVMITISDHGKGIRTKDLPRIFEPFYSTKHEIGRGIGIGLAVVKYNIEHEFGGWVSVSSKYRQGTSFILSLPLPNNHK